MESFISPQRWNTDTISKCQDCSQNKVHIDFHTLYSRLFSTSRSLNRLCVRNTCFDMCSVQEENQDSCIKMFWLLDRKLSSNLHPVMPKEHLPFVSVLKSELNTHTEPFTGPNDFWNIFSCWNIAAWFLWESQRSCLQTTSSWFYAITAPHPYENALTAR